MAPVTLGLIVASLVLAGVSGWSCKTLYGARAMWIFAAIAVPLGWFAEEMGSTRGWFFGSYTYTDVLGPQIGSVPFVIPLMWFGLCHVGLVLASLLLWRAPQAPATLPAMAVTALMAAMLVTAFDLGADPFFVYVLKAWIMTKKDGAWFGETVRGFEGWMFVSFVIVALFLAIVRPRLAAPFSARQRNAAIVPLIVYACFIAFQVTLTEPIALRVIAFFAMGIPALAAGVAWAQWASNEGKGDAS